MNLKLPSHLGMAALFLHNPELVHGRLNSKLGYPDSYRDSLLTIGIVPDSQKVLGLESLPVHSIRLD